MNKISQPKEMSKGYLKTHLINRMDNLEDYETAVRTVLLNVLWRKYSEDYGCQWLIPFDERKNTLTALRAQRPLTLGAYSARSKQIMTRNLSVACQK